MRRQADLWRWWRRFRKAAVYFITSDKIIQAVMTGGVVAIIQYWGVVTVEAANVLLALTPLPRVPQAVAVLVLMHTAVGIAFWADHHTEEWRQLVEATTGEEAADDEAE